MRKVIPGFGAALLIFVVFSVLSYFNITRLIGNVSMRAQSFNTIERTENLLDYISDAEIARDGFIITGEESYLDSYYTSRRIIEIEMCNLRKEAQGREAQRRRFDVLGPLVRGKLDNLEESIRFQRKRGFNAGVQRRLTDEGRDMYAAISNVIGALVRGEGDVARGLEAETIEITRGAIATLLLGTLVSFLVLYWIATMLSREISERKRAEEDLKLFRSLIDQSNDAVFIMNPETGNFLDVNEKACGNLGYSREELLRMKVPEVEMTIPDYVSWERHAREIMEGGASTVEGRHRRKDGSTFPVEVNVKHVSHAKGDYMVAMARDVTRRKRAEERVSEYVGELEQRSLEMELLGRMGGMLQACTTAGEIYSVIDRSVRRIFPKDSGSVYLFSAAANTLEVVSSWGGDKPGEQVIGPDDCWALRLGRAYLVEGPGGGLLCPHIKHALRTAYLCMPMIAHGEIAGLLYLEFEPQCRECSEEARKRLMEYKRMLASTVAENIALSLSNFTLRETLYNQSIHDPLTELFNRRHMEEVLERELHRMSRKDRPLGIIMLDIDHFKLFNDTFGHEAGDMLLAGLGAFLRKHIREEDYAFRYGGEEFVIILPETTPDISQQRAEQIRQEVRYITTRYHGRSLGAITVSLGVASYPDNGATQDELLRAADSALYRAKAGGRDRVETA
ncbi:MAG TPA: diguanylate cyclase [Dissulfurispiraceae bacterium]